MRKTLGIITAALFLSACGGGGGNNGGGVITGSVLDGTVVSGRVCFDINNDNSCTSEDTFVKTNSDGSFELTYSDPEAPNKYRLIADVRAWESSDDDYGTDNNHPTYDYVMAAFDTKATDVVISPISTYMEQRVRINREDPIKLPNQVATMILNGEKYPLGTKPADAEIEKLLTGNYIQGKKSSDPFTKNFSTRLHNLNNVTARKMQKSQLRWEEKTAALKPNLTWEESSRTITNNANLNVFNNFDEIVNKVGAMDFASFDAISVETSFNLPLPNDSSINGVFDLEKTVAEASSAFAGATTYKYTMTTSDYNGGYLYTDVYYTWNSNSLTAYQYNPKLLYDVFGTNCFSVTVPINYAGLSISDMVKMWNQSVPEMNAAMAGYGSITTMSKVSSPPMGCSESGQLLNNFDVSVASPTEPVAEKPAGSYVTPPPSPEFHLTELGTINADAFVVPPEPQVTYDAPITSNLANGNFMVCPINSGEIARPEPCRKK